jgi:hypothetical protein
LHLRTWKRFRQVVLADRGLFEQLRQTADMDVFVALAVRLGKERDCLFTEEEVRAALRECRRVWLERAGLSITGSYRGSCGRR